MPAMIPTWCAVAIVFVVSAFLSRALARRNNRDEYIYFFMGLFLGPLAILVVMTPLPNEHRSRMAAKPLRVVHGRKCPECKKDAGVRSLRCPHCGRALDTAWWEAPEGPISAKH